MFKLIALLVWVLFFVVGFKIVWSTLLKPYLDDEMKEENTSDGAKSKKQVDKQ